MTRRRSLSLAIGCALAACVASPVLAQTDDTATAYALFEQGRQLATLGKLEEACPKFLASSLLVPKVSTLLNLADCYERSGRVASAWARFAEARALAHREGQTDAEASARDRENALAPKLPRLAILAQSPVPGLVVKRDGSEMPEGAFGTAVPVDPGPHEIEADAPGKQRWATTVTVGPSPGTLTVSVPGLEELPPAPNVGEPRSSVTPPRGDATAAGSPSAGPPSSPWRAVGLGVAGAGVLGVIAGTVAGAVAISKKNAAEAAGCLGNHCPPTAGGLRDDAQGAATASTVAFIVGGVLAAGGASLWWWAPRGSSRAGVSPNMGVRIGGGGELWLEGAW